MATAMQNPRPQREVIEFPPNVPVTVALKYSQGRHISNQHGERMMFTTCDNRVLFLDLPVAAQIEALGVNTGESFSLTKQTDGKKGSPSTWAVSRTMGEQSNGTFVAPALSETATPKPPAMATAATGTGGARNHLVDEAKRLVDEYAEVLEHARVKHQGRIKPEDVRSLLLSVYIGKGRSAA